MNADIFLKYESEVRSYCRRVPVIFDKAKNSTMYNTEGLDYIDFLSGAGSLNYGHNNDSIKEKVIRYLVEDKILLGLDLYSASKKQFIDTFQNKILIPRDLNYKIQFTSPTGTSVVESAIKLARKYTGRKNILTFTNAFHGMSAVSLSLTGNKKHRQSLSVGDVTRLPYDGYVDGSFDSIKYYRKLLEDQSSGIDLPAAIILESIQGEGGVNIASTKWLRELRDLSKEFGILLIIDDIQAGCGRSGRFFSFERAEIKPDMVCVSKSISGIGLPMAILLLTPELDVWGAGEDNGTFRGNNLAFTAATAMINNFWDGFAFESVIKRKEEIIKDFFFSLSNKYSHLIKQTRGLGLMQGIEFYNYKVAATVAEICIRRRLIIELCGPSGQVLKLMPALTIDESILHKGLAIIELAIEEYSSQVVLDAAKEYVENSI